MAATFISYSRKDKPFAERLLPVLADHSHDAWIDWEDIPYGTGWMDEVRGAIESSDTFLFLISPDSVKSATCAAEIAHALSLRKRIIPLLVRDTVEADISPEIRALNWVPFRPTDNFDSAVAKLLETINTDLEWVRTHTRLLVRATEWERHGNDESYLLRGVDLEMANGWLARAAQGKQPQPAPLHYAYVRAGQVLQARELERLQTLYRKALARQLAAQASQMQIEADALLDRAMLLAVESHRRLPNAEADRVLRTGLRLRAQEISRWRNNGDKHVLAASADGLWVAGCGSDGDVVVRKCTDFAVHWTAHIDGQVCALVFVPGRPTLCAANSEGALILFNFETGESPSAMGAPNGPLRSLIALPDGKHIVSLGAGGATCWQLNDGKARWHLQIEGEAWAGAANVAGTLLAIGADDCVLRLVDAVSGEVRHKCVHEKARPVLKLERGSTDAGVVAAGFLDEAGLVCSAGLDGSVRWWNVATGEERHRGLHHRDVLSMAVHAGRGLVASGSLDCTLRVWDAEGHELARLAHQSGVTQLSWSADGGWLLSACGDGCARLWEVAQGGGGLTEQDLREAARCVHGDWVEAAVLSAGGVPVSVSSNGEAIAWTVGEPDWRGRNHEYDLKHAICSDDGAYLLVFIDQPTLILYDVKDGFSWRLLKHPNFVDAAWIIRDGAILTTCWDGAVREFDLKTLELRYLQQHSARVWNAAMSVDQGWIATAVQGEPCVRVWKRGEAQFLAELPHTQQVRSIVFSPDGTLLSTASEDGTVRVWDWAVKQALWIGQDTGIAWCVAFDPTGRLVASGNDGNVVLRDARSGAVRLSWPQQAQVSSIAFSPNGGYLAACLSYQGPFEVRLWDVKKGELVGCLAHEEQVHDMKWNRDGTLLATASQDHRVRVFDARSSRELVRLQFRDICGSACFVPDTQELLSTSYDGSLRLSIIAPDILVSRTLARLPRHLTRAEWQQYLPDEPIPEPAAGSETQ